MCNKSLNFFLLIACIMFGVVTSMSVYGHCELPCGIYDDHARIEAMLEDVATIEKADLKITELSQKKDSESKNQLVRWVMNKEEYSQKVISVISNYFLTQRVNPGQKDYKERLVAFNTVMIAAMKTKQNVNVEYAKKLKKSIEALSIYYPEHKE